MTSKREESSLKVWKKPKRSSKDSDEESIAYSNMNTVQKSPSECELRIQDGRIFSILSVTIDKVKIALSLPELLEDNAAKLKKFLKREQIDHIQHACNRSLGKHLIPNKSIVSKGTLSPLAPPKSRKVEVPINFSTAVVMETLWNNLRLRQAILEDYTHSHGNCDSVFINCLESLVSVMEQKLGTTAAEERKRAIRLERVERQNANLTEKINKMESILKQQRKKLEAQLKEKLLEKRTYEDNIASMVLNFKLNVHMTM